MNTIEELLTDISLGKMVIVLDDEDRENEGDLIMSASQVRPEDINFMAKYARGLICLTLTKERCNQLNLPLMVRENSDAFATNFTVSIEAAEGVTTGISAYDRAHTVRTAVKPDALPGDLTQPGHVFPLMAQPGGVLTRAGHTEAGVDLARLAGLEPAACIVEILNEDGTMARRPELEAFAQEHGLKIGTIADLIHYRLENERTVQQLSEQDVDTDFGAFKLFVFQDVVEKQQHYALVHGEINAEEPTLVRVHLQNFYNDVLHVQHEHFGLPLDIALEEISSNGPGVVVVLGCNRADVPALDALVNPEQPVQNTDQFSKKESERVQELRTYGVGAQILAELGVTNMRVLSAPKKFHGLSGFGLEVVEYVEPNRDM